MITGFFCNMIMNGQLFVATYQVDECLQEIYGIFLKAAAGARFKTEAFEEVLLFSALYKNGEIKNYDT